jgi:hypothetical protein
MKHFILTLFFTLVTAGYGFSQEGMHKIADNEQPMVSISDTNRLYVQNVKQGDVLQVFSIVGIKVYETKLESASKEVALNVPKGYYIVKIANTVRKIAVK